MTEEQSSKLKGILLTIGPGILFAGAAIGGSHLVQSTRAGADYGFTLISIVILVLIFKYPFFEFVHRYTAAMDESILHGYRRLGMPAIVIFFLIAIVAAIMNAAAVTLVCASLAGNMAKYIAGPELAGDNLLNYSTVGVLLVVAAILLIGKYKALDKLMKVMIVVLAVCTISAFFIALGHGSSAPADFVSPKLVGIGFLLALMGWMPAPVDVSVWPSLWALERKKETNHKATVKESQIDFHIGYISTGVLALAFVGLGALVMFGTGKEFSNSGIAFSAQFIQLYTETLGAWSWWLISIVAFITMFSTVLTVMDGYTRTMKGCIELMTGIEKLEFLYITILTILTVISFSIIAWWISGIKSMLDIATILAFLSAPPFAWLNYKAVVGKHMPEEHRPGIKMRILSWLGLIFLTGFSLVYIYNWFTG